MKSKRYRNLTIALIVLIVLVLLILPKNKQTISSENIAKCIGENSILYVQAGCTHCRTQENMFGENLEYLTIVDCYETPEKCSEIKGTPSWEIENKIYPGIKTPQELKNLTNCNLEK